MGIRSKIALLLMLMLLAAIANLCVVFYYQGIQRHSSFVINAAGRQRMLTQKISKLVLSIAKGNKDDRPLLQDAAGLYQASLEALWQGGEVMGVKVPPAPADMEDAFQKNKALWQLFRTRVDTVLKERRHKKTFRDAVDYICLHNNRLLDASNEVTLAFEDVFSRYSASKLRITLVSMLGFDALVFFVGYFLSDRLVKPLKKLSVAAAEVGKGNFPEKIEISSSDEIGELGSAFGKMIADLEHSRNTLISAKDYTDTILRSMIDPLIVVDFEGAIRAVNHAAQNLLGYAEEELLGKPVGVIFKMKVDEAPKKTRLQELMKEDFIRNFKAKSGERIPVGLYTSIMKDRTGKFLGYVCVARDMRQIHQLVVDLDHAKAELEVWSKTLEKKVEERTRELRHARDYTEKIIASMNSILIVLDPEFTIRTVNRFALELLGYEERDVLGRTINGFFSSTENAGACSSNGIAAELAHNGGCVYNAQLAVQTRDGREIPVLFSSSAMRDEHGVVQGVVCVARDVSEYKRIMDKLARANAEIKSFAAIVSHDLRAPLVNLKGFSHELKMASREIQEMLEDVAPLMAEDRRARIRELLKHEIPESLEFITTSTTVMERLISHILTLSRIGSRPLNFTEINTGELVRNKLKTFRYQIERKNIRVSVKELPTVVADEIALDQIFGNVLSNAINYLDPGRPGEIDISGERRKDDALFVIKDNGQGIAEEDRHKVFEFFRRGRHAYAVSGEGMGLPYVKAMLERHGGEIWFESEEGVGTAFYFTVGTAAPCGNSEEKSTFG